MALLSRQIPATHLHTLTVVCGNSQSSIGAAIAHGVNNDRREDIQGSCGKGIALTHSRSNLSKRLPASIDGRVFPLASFVERGQILPQDVTETSLR
jgi:hypothetical protein